MPQGFLTRLGAILGFGLAWLLASLPLVAAAGLLQDGVSYVAAVFNNISATPGLMQLINLFGTLLLYVGASMIIGLLGGMLVLLPLLSLVWQALLGIRRNPFLGLRRMLPLAILHSLISGLLLSVFALFYIMVQGISGISGILPVEMLLFFTCAAGAWVVLPHAVDNLPGEWGLLIGSIGGMLGMLLLAPFSRLAVESGSMFQLSICMLLAGFIAGMFIGGFLPWLLRRDRAFWLELENGGRLQQLRLGPRPVEAGNYPAAQFRLGDASLPGLRFSLSGLTIFLEYAGGGRPLVVQTPLAIRHGSAVVRVRSFDESDNWHELEVGQLSGGNIRLEELPGLEELPAQEAGSAAAEAPPAPAADSSSDSAQ
ncbi:MAG: hypothetical protein H7A35_00650 [Planctomycetales bacterium]|nr:hypothetical protein [bacterium]UNM08572.1 MAG: hypothetical protein H7A35_00650 [Planctomycetales bacterium]